MDVDLRRGEGVGRYNGTEPPDVVHREQCFARRDVVDAETESRCDMGSGIAEEQIALPEHDDTVKKRLEIGCGVGRYNHGLTGFHTAGHERAEYVAAADVETVGRLVEEQNVGP